MKTYLLLTLLAVSASFYTNNAMAAGGIEFVSPGSKVDRGYGGAIQADGKIVTAGQMQASGEDHVIIRQNSDGSLDSSFNKTGIATTFFNKQNDVSAPDYANTVVIQPDQKIVTGGVGYYYKSGYIGDFALSRWTAAGVLDASFGSGGKVTTNFGTSKSSVYEILFAGGGKMIAVGNDIGVGERVALAKYDSAGALDKTFGTKGKILHTLGMHPTSGALDASGKIVVSGGTGVQAALARFTAAGVLDNTFGTGGKKLLSVGAIAQFEHLVILADGKIVAVGSAEISADRQMLVARFLSSGALDTSFGAGAGYVTLNPGQIDVATSVAVQADGKLVVGGYSAYPNGAGGEIGQVALARLDSDGLADNGFGIGGVTVTPVSASTYNSAYAYQTRLQADGKIVLMGEGKRPGFANIDMVVLRYDQFGALDAGF